MNLTLKINNEIGAIYECLAYGLWYTIFHLGLNSEKKIYRKMVESHKRDKLKSCFCFFIYIRLIIFCYSHCFVLVAFFFSSLVFVWNIEMYVNVFLWIRNGWLVCWLWGGFNYACVVNVCAICIYSVFWSLRFLVIFLWWFEYSVLS